MNPNATRNNSNFKAEAKFSDKTKDAIINGEIDTAMANSVKAKAVEMVEALTKEGKASNATVRIEKYQTKDGKEGISRSISFSGKDSKEGELHTLVLSLNDQLEVTYNKFQTYDPATNKVNDLKFPDANNRVTGYLKALENAGFVKPYERVAVSPVQNVVNKFMHEVSVYNKAQENPEKRIILGRGVYARDEKGELVRGADGKAVPILDENGKRKWSNSETITRKDGSTFEQIMLRQGDDRITINIDNNGQILVGNYINRKSFNEEQQKYTNTSFAYNLNDWANNKGFVFSTVLKNVLEDVKYVAPVKPEKTEKAAEQETSKEGETPDWVNAEEDIELPFN